MSDEPTVRADTAGGGQGPQASEEPAIEGTGSGAPGGIRALGAAKMEEVYGFSIDPANVSGGYLEVTVDHLFGAVWTRPGLDVATRRLLTIGAICAQGQHQLLDIQFGAALDRGEMDEEQVREAVVHLAHYVGWPLSTGAQAAAERAIAAHHEKQVPGGQGGTAGVGQGPHASEEPAIEGTHRGAPGGQGGTA